MKKQSWFLSVIGLCAAGCASSGGSSEQAGQVVETAVTSTGPKGDAAVYCPSAPASLSASETAITETLANNSDCSGLTNFYWEIGNASGALASGRVGLLVGPNSVMTIDSASKLVFGAYVVQKYATNMSAINTTLLRMLGGYENFSDLDCSLSPTVEACQTAFSNDKVIDAGVGVFYYSGGDLQAYAADPHTLNLGSDSAAQLTIAIKDLVGKNLAFNYVHPELGGGISTSASDYATFLRSILSGSLAIKNHLGEDAVCTLPGCSSSSDAGYSPAAPLAWHYSYAHWVEDDPTHYGGDGAFSSPGAAGFYPWIDATKEYYGIIARYSLETGAYEQSANCGAAIRRAFFCGTEQ